MKFVFRFQKILDFKISQEEAAQQKLAHWVKKYNHALEQVSQIGNNQASLQKLLLSSETLNTDIGLELTQLNEYKSSLNQQVKDITEPLNQARLEYLKAKQEKETFEILKKKEYNLYLYNEKKKQQHILDEYARNSFILKQQDQ